MVQRHALIEQCAPDHLVDCVVAPNIFTQRDELAGVREEPGGMQPSSAIEDALA